MNFFKRALTSIIRTPLKSFILFFVIFILGVAVSGAVSVRNAIHTTDLNLRRNMRPVVVFAENWDAIANIWEREGRDSFDLLSPDTLYEIGQLPYVEYFDYSMRIELLSNELNRWYPIPGELDNPGITHFFDVRGVSHSEFIDIRQGFVEMAEGRSFTEEQLVSGASVVVISSCLADHNGLTVGDIVTLGTISLSADEEGEVIIDMLQAYDFEIIGLFSVVGMEEVDFGSSGYRTFSEQVMINTANQLYLPNSIVRKANESLNYQSARLDESLGAEINWDSWEEVYRMNPIFVLYDPLYLDDFREVTQSILGDAWHLSDGSNRFAPISDSMGMMRDMADGILIGVSIASLATLGLLITLFLHDRRREIGIYLALGEKKSGIISQILTEVIVLAGIAITVSLFLGVFISNHLSHELLQNDISHVITPTREFLSPEILEPWEIMGFPPPMSGEEMLEFYDFSMTPTVVAMFYVISLAIVILSTVIPIIYLIRLKPKEVLM